MKNQNLFLQIKPYILIGLIGIVACPILFGMVYIFRSKFEEIMSVASYLTWHNVFEFSSILISLSVFVVSYYTYEQTGNLRSIFLGSIFFAVGMLDGFHTLSFKGMPAFLIENDTANRATTFWIVSRYIAAVGFACASFIHGNKKSSINKQIFAYTPAIVSIFALIIISFRQDILPPMYIEGVGLTDYKIWSEYIIMSLFLFATIKYIYEYSKTKERFLLLISVSLLISINSEMAFVLYISVYDIFNYLGHIYKFIAFFIIFRAIFINNIQKPYLELYKAKQKLRHYADNLDMLVHKRTEELKQLNDKLLEDLDYARDIQKALFPTKIPRWSELSFEMGYFPAERVSGDFYNIFEVDSENVAFYIGDVSGHGVPAAMLTVFLNQTMKVLVDDWIKKEKGVDILDPSQVLSSIYKSFNMTNFKEEVYIVMLYGIYNIQTRKLTYSSAGFNTQPIVIRQSGEVFDIDIKGFPICKLIEFFNGEYENSFIILEPKDKILFYTDGLIEANNKDGCFYEDKRLVDLLKKNYQKPAAEMCQLISDSIFEFVDGNQPKDDVTFFTMEVGPDKV